MNQLMGEEYTVQNGTILLRQHKELPKGVPLGVHIVTPIIPGGDQIDDLLKSPR